MARREWPTKPEKPGKVKISTPDPETGKVVEITRAQSTVKAAARAARRDAAPPNLLQITAAERRDLIAGRISRLFRQTKLEGVEVGYRYIVSWDQLHSFADPETKTKLTPPAHPACWVTVTATPKNLTKGKGWPYDLKVERHDRDRPDPLLKVKGGYTRDRSRALDPDAPPVLSGKDMDKIDAEAKQVYADRKAASEEERRKEERRQERVAREYLRDTLAGLSPLEKTVLLAKMTQLCDKAREGGDAADARDAA